MHTRELCDLRRTVHAAVRSGPPWRPGTASVRWKPVLILMSVTRFRVAVWALLASTCPAGLEPVAACVWESDVLIDGTQRVVPDGCVDLVWLGDQLVVVGPDTGPVVWEPVGVVACGIRLRPGTACAVLGLPANEVRDQQVPLTSVWPGSAGLSEALDAADPRLGCDC